MPPRIGRSTPESGLESYFVIFKQKITNATRDTTQKVHERSKTKTKTLKKKTHFITVCTLSDVLELILGNREV